MTATEVRIPTPDGPARAFAFMPGGQGPWPAVICFIDALGIRPALFAMCERLASHDYFVLLPDIFWRAGPYDPINVAEALRTEASRKETFARFTATTDPERATRDTRGCLDFLADQPKVRGRAVGVVGYCMGGGRHSGPLAISPIGSLRQPPSMRRGWRPTRPTARICWRRR